jgi:hypothetical protein
LKSVFVKKLNFVLLQINFFLVFLDCFDVLMLKINFFKKYFDAFSSKKHFEKKCHHNTQRAELDVCISFSIYI